MGDFIVWIFPPLSDILVSVAWPTKSAETFGVDQGCLQALGIPQGITEVSQSPGNYILQRLRFLSGSRGAVGPRGEVGQLCLVSLCSGRQADPSWSSFRVNRSRNEPEFEINPIDLAWFLS